MTAEGTGWRDPVLVEEVDEEAPRSTRGVIWAKLAYTTLEAAFGVAVLVAAVVHFDPGEELRRQAINELSTDPGDFLGRHELSASRNLHPHVLIGAAILVYALCKGGLLVGFLRDNRRVAQIGSVIFTALALGAVVVLLLRPTAIRVVLAAADVVVALVLLREARRLRRVGGRGLYKA